MVWGSVFFAEFINPLLYKNVFNAGGDHGAYIAMVLENNIGKFGLTVILVIVALVFFYIIHQRTTHINEKDGANLTDTNYAEDGEKEKDIDYNTNIVTKCTDGTTKEGTGTTSDTVDNRNNINGEFVEKSGEKEWKKDILYPYDPKRDLENYHYPTLDLLMKYENDGLPYINMEEQNANKNRIVDTLRNFGIEISSIKATVGARITLYEISLAPGVNASKLRGLEDDIALALSSHNVHFIIPIPGKGTIGIEVPNIRPSIVSLESILNTKQFQETTMELPCAIGKIITNEVFMFDLTKAPHILIAGSTGQGKSVALNTMIMSLLYKKHPAEMKLVLMDPYGVELGVYSQIANHFLATLPNESTIVSKSNKAVSTLNGLCKEMEARYDLLKKAYVRNIKEYNRKFIDRQLNPTIGHRFMPYIVVVIDEYGDFIEEKGQDFETPIVQLAQYARAVGIHMIISTKRPTNDIITGAIKTNFPTRIAFRLPERIDSQVILDCDGAEDLLGNGDMLFRAGKSIDCIRVQCAFVDTPEVNRICQFVSQQQGYISPFELPDPYFDDTEYGESHDVDMQHLDPLFEDAARLIVMTQEGSTSLIQRKFAIGYNRAGRLMDQFEKAGIVGAAHGSRPREVLIMDEKSLENILSQLGF
jgi:S-DNA-T family DNA segregation ATPase FtsK/SpoIIIE